MRNSVKVLFKEYIFTVEILFKDSDIQNNNVSNFYFPGYFLSHYDGNAWNAY